MYDVMGVPPVFAVSGGANCTVTALSPATTAVTVGLPLIVPLGCTFDDAHDAAPRPWPFSAATLNV
jgi:hypothetical protein